jgi:chromosome segregation protein
MRLKRIELIGFKSFADKTVLDFHPGITAIVGPNGCGKSNIVDAFKWVLGEQSAKSLRGDSMEDVIFFGSTTRKTRGMAEVTLVLSGVSGGDNDNDSEISVTRRLYRSGESEYLLNKSSCRLKDIKNIFLDTGLELKAYSILEQGRMNDILSSKPQERRFLIEEVAGVMKYKVRRAEATQKLESSRYNLQRLQDIISEVKRQMSSIDRYAKKAERYKKLLEEVRDIDIRIAKRDIRRLTGEVNEISSSLEQLRLRETKFSTEMHSIEALMEKKKSEYIDREKGLDDIRKRLHEVEKAMTEAEGKVALLKKESDNLKEKMDGLKKMDVDLTSEKERATEQLSRIESEFTNLHSRLKESEKVLQEKDDFLKEIINDISEYENILDNQRRNIFSKAEEGSILRNEVRHLSTIIDEIDRKIQKLIEEMNSVETMVSSLKDEYLQTEDECLKLESALADHKNRREDMDKRLKNKKEELKTIEERLYKSREELAAMNSRYESLKELHTSQKVNVGEDIKALCQIADILETAPEYESAIEAVLGDKLNALIVERHNDIMIALKHIKKHGAKRCGFISLNPSSLSQVSKSVTGKTGASADDLVRNAIDVVKVREGFRAVAMALLADVVIVKDMDTAFSLRERADKYLYLATLDGEVIEPSGIVYGGIDRGLLRIRRQIKELEKDIESKRHEIVKNEEVIIGLMDDIGEYEEEIASIDLEISKSQNEFHELRMRLDNLREESEQQQKKLHYLRTELQNEKNEEKSMRALKEEKEMKCKELEVERTDAENELKALQEKIISKKEMLEDARSELTEIKLSITSMRERIKTLQSDKERLGTEISEVEKKRIAIENDRLSIEEEIGLKEQEIRRRQEAMKSNILLAKELQEKIETVNDSIAILSDEIKILEEEHKLLSSELDKLRDKLNQVEMKKMELTMRLNYIKEDIKKAYNVSIDGVDEVIEVSTEDEERLPQLKERLQEMGPVSLGTLEEYEELKTRYEFLKKQQDDLLNSIATLEETIHKINRSTQRRLTDAFNALNEKFKEVFRTLFGEGRAELILTEGSILESGIEIVAQPPGKRLKNLLALSGGEQALTALSLLFAGFMIKPTPMCVLDEVDAPLDESNTGRFVKMLSGLSRDIQFITITHNRLTMEVADYIYGVTMEEPGVSKVVSMHLAEMA